MINVYKSDTGQFVLIHAPSQTVIIEENLEQAFDKMQAYVKANHPEIASQIMRPFEQPGSGKSDQSFFARAALMILLCALPFLWLGGLHYSVSSLLGEFSLRNEQSVELKDEVERLKGEVDSLRLELSRSGAK